MSAGSGSISTSLEADERQVGRLRRSLGFLGTVAVSVGVMAPTLAMSATGVEPARIIGRAAPLAYALAAFGVGLVAYGFVRLSGFVSHAGSVYAFVGRAVGPRAGFFTGWALLGTYIVFPPVSMIGVATFGQAFLRDTGISPSAGWLPIALVAWALIGVLASRGVRNTARALLGVEIVSMALILVLVAVIYEKLATGSAPSGRTLNTDWVHVPAGTGFSTVALAATFGFLSFAGFEAAGSFGEESSEPKRTVPRSIVLAIAVGGVFYMLCMVAQTLGFGTSTAGVKEFTNSQAPLGQLARTYVDRPMADALDAGAMLSALGAGLGGISVASRMLFALGRDGILPRRLSRVSSTGAPVMGLAVALTLSLAALLSFGLAGTPALSSFFYLATMGVLSLLVMYVLTNVAAVRRLSRRSKYEAVLPIIGTGVAGFVLYHTVWPVPAAPYRYFPYVVLGWLTTALIISAVVPGFVARVRDGLARRADGDRVR